MSTDPWTTATLSGPCAYCGGYHIGACPRVKAYEYHPNGRIKRVEFYDTAPACTCYEADTDP